MQDAKLSSTDDITREFTGAFANTDVPPGAEAVERLGTGGDGAEDPPREDSAADTPERGNAADIIRDIGRAFVDLRQNGRSQAWADLEDRLMQSAHTLISAGLMTPKDWIGLTIDIEQFRKQEQGTHKPPGDFLEEWLSMPSEFQSRPKLDVETHIPKKADRIENKRRDAVAKSRSRSEAKK